MVDTGFSKEEYYFRMSSCMSFVVVLDQDKPTRSGNPLPKTNRSIARWTTVKGKK